MRIWKIKPSTEGSYGARPTAAAADDDDNEAGDALDPDEESDEDEDDPQWTAVVVADFDQHRSSIGRVEWNITG